MMTSAPRISTGWRLQQFGEENGQGNDRSKRRSQSASPVRFRAPSKRYNNIVWFKSTALDDTLKQGYGLAWLMRGGKLLYRRQPIKYKLKYQKGANNEDNVRSEKASSVTQQ
ncbi:hypothetical protein F442_13464 [Phytophthora nicotianae P10297]|uniref:Uncharacterized protein n=1 Tax=Phytophthora nicotianae P10297 TaxID=1317064 RepID=W2YVK9_PHYNI|nr:hypothetical protein F442_13464 [Phytophthora nicotianae P10297]